MKKVSAEKLNCPCYRCEREQKYEDKDGSVVCTHYRKCKIWRTWWRGRWAMVCRVLNVEKGV